MDIAKAKQLLIQIYGKSAEKLSDQEVLNIIEPLRRLADFAVDCVLEEGK